MTICHGPMRFRSTGLMAGYRRSRLIPWDVFLPRGCHRAGWIGDQCPLMKYVPIGTAIRCQLRAYLCARRLVGDRRRHLERASVTCCGGTEAPPRQPNTLP